MLSDQQLKMLRYVKDQKAPAPKYSKGGFVKALDRLARRGYVYYLDEVATLTREGAAYLSKWDAMMAEANAAYKEMRDGPKHPSKTSITHFRTTKFTLNKES